MEKDNSKPKEDIRTIRTKRDLANSLEQLLMVKNIDDISIKEITDNALISKNTFYNNFMDKNELLLFLFSRYEESLIKEIKPLLEKSFRATRFLSLKKCIEIIVHFFYETPLPFEKIIQNDSSHVIFFNLNLFLQDLLKRVDKEYHVLNNKNNETLTVDFYAGSFSSVIYFAYKEHLHLPEKEMVKNLYRLTFMAIE